MSRVSDDRDLGAFIPSHLDDYGLTPCMPYGYLRRREW